MKRIITLLFVILTFCINVYADSTNVIDAEFEILKCAQIDIKYTDNLNINSELIDSAVNLALEKKKAYDSESFARTPKTKIQINIKGCKKKNIFLISSDICDYKEFVDEIILCTDREMKYYIVPNELTFNKNNEMSITVEDSDNILDKYTGLGNIKKIKLILIIIFSIVVLAMGLFLLFISKKRLDKSINKKMLNITSYAVIGLSIFSILILFIYKPQSGSVSKIESDENMLHYFNVEYGTNGDKATGIYLGIPLFDKKFDIKYIAAYRTDEELLNESSVIGGNYNSSEDILQLPIEKKGNYFIKNNHISFTDIKENQEGLNEAIEILASKNIVTGKAEGMFGPEDNITRAEIVTMLCKMLYLDTENVNGDKFTDVSSSDWYYKYVMTGRNNNLLAGFEDNSFKPNDNITRQQMAAIAASMLYRMGYSDKADISILKRYKDYDEIAEWAVNHIAVVDENEINIWEDYFEPNRPLTRGEAAIILYRLYLFI